MLPLRKIICPTDFSDFSRGATDQAIALAAHFGAELCLLHVTQPVQPLPGLAPYPGGMAFNAAAYEKAVHESAGQELRGLIEQRSFKDIKVRPLLRRGQPAAEIVSAAAQEEAGLIVIGTHGWTGWRRHIFGSVTEKVLRLAQCPVLILRAEKPTSEPLFPLRKVVCSTDFSEPSYAALDVASEWAAHGGAELCLVHVVEPLQQPGLILDKAEIEEAMQADAVQRLRQVIQERLPPASAARPIVRTGSAADEIAALAAQEEAGLIVIATHGAGAWRTVVSGTAVERILFGSVTTNVMRLSSCPILTVRMPDTT